MERKVRKAIYARKRFWESNSAYENRANYLIGCVSKYPELELANIDVGTNTTTIFYYEIVEENSTIIKGFSSK